MIDNNILGLYDHNLESYEKVDYAYQNGEKIVGLLHATGTGKTLNALQLALDNKDKKIIYLTPYNSIIEHIKEIINDNPNLDIDRDFGHVQFMTYSSLVKMSKLELENLDVDMLMLDEFHHIGAPVWGDRIETILESHPELLVFGLSAYSVRDRGSAYERDLAEEGGDELFSDKIVSNYSLVDAMMDGVLPVPVYKSAHIHLEKFADHLGELLENKKIDKDLSSMIMKVIHDVKRRISSDDEATKLLKENVKPDGKYIYFCPSVSKEGVNDPYTIMEQTKIKFIEMGYKADDLCFYVSCSNDLDRGKESRECFYHDVDTNGKDVSKKLRIMFAINQYNEGVHAPNVDGVILGRETRSDIVFFEQIGRALSVRGDTHRRIIEYNKLSKEEIFDLCIKNKLEVTSFMSKGDMIERLVAPVIIDLVGNYSFIRDLVTDLKHRIRDNKVKEDTIDRIIKFSESAISVEFENQDLFDTLLAIKERLAPKTWEESYILAKAYYDTYDNLNINRHFKTDNGITYDDYGYALGEWISIQRSKAKKGELEEDKIKKLNDIGMIWSTRKSFNEAYKLACNYRREKGNLKIPYSFKTEDGVNYNIYGYCLGNWLANQRRRKRLGLLSCDEIKKLEDIDIEWVINKTWEESYSYLEKYFIEHNNIDMPKSYIASDGYTLGTWLYNQKSRYREGKLDNDKILLLEKFNIDWGTKARKNPSWEEYFSFLANYYNVYGNYDIGRFFSTFDGINYDKDGYKMGAWFSRQRLAYKNNKMDAIKLAKFRKIGLFTEKIKTTHKTFEESYLIAYAYYVRNGHLNIPTTYICDDLGVSCTEGYNLGSWIYVQRNKFKKSELDIKKIELLNDIGMIWDINQNYAFIKNLFRELKINPRRYSSQVKNLSYIEFEAKVRYLQDMGFPIVDGEKVHNIFIINNTHLESIYGISRKDLIRKYVPYSIDNFNILGKDSVN